MNDVAAAILQRTGPITALKLQKLCYYAHAWHLVWEETPLTDARIEAWYNGPALPALQPWLTGQFKVEVWPGGSAARLSSGAQETVQSVVDYYAGYTAQQLIDHTRSEQPWIDAWASRSGTESAVLMTNDALYTYYASL